MGAKIWGIVGIILGLIFSIGMLVVFMMYALAKGKKR